VHDAEFSGQGLHLARRFQPVRVHGLIPAGGDEEEQQRREEDAQVQVKSPEAFNRGAMAVT
jgi:hypothetical protein